MKAFIILLILTFNTSVASAETYKWEDSKGVHYSDNAASVPEKYRGNVLSEPTVENNNRTPQVGTGIPLQGSVYGQTNQSANYQAILEQQRRTADAMRQQQARALAESHKKAEGAIQSLANFMAVWLLIGLGVFIVWVLTIVDIVRSEFVTPSNKTVWVILVVLIPILGMLLYSIFGSSQKRNYISPKDIEQAELLARLKSKESTESDFIV